MSLLHGVGGCSWPPNPLANSSNASSSKRSSVRFPRPRQATSTPCAPSSNATPQPLYGTVILPRLGDAASAEEVLRDTLATAVEKINRFTWQGNSIYPWLRQIAINKVYDVHRQSSARAASPTRWCTRCRSSPIRRATPTPS